MPNFSRAKLFFLLLSTIGFLTNNAIAKNGIDLYSGTKSEFAVDYTSPNGLLTIERNYLNQKSGWVPNLTPRLLYIDIGQAASSEGFFPQTIGTCLEFVNQILVRYKDPVNEPKVTETYYKRICTKFLNRSDKPVIYAWLKGKQYKLFEESGVFVLEGGARGSLKIEAITGSSISSAVWKMTQSSGTLSYFNQSGQILKTIVPTRGSIDYQFINNQLQSKTDNTGRRISFEYNDKGRLNLAILPNGANITYIYEDDENETSKKYWLISQVNWPDGEELVYLYNESNNIVGTGEDSFLTGKMDAYNNRMATYKYEYGKATSTEGFEGTNKSEITERNYVYVKETDGLGAQYTWYFGAETEDGKRHLTSKRQPAGAGSKTGLKSNTYDSDNNITQKRDYNGNKTQFAYDPVHNFQTVRVEGIASNQNGTYTTDGTMLPTGVTKTSTQWDVELRKPIKFASPKLLTTIVYQGSSDPFNGNQTANCTEASLVELPVICRVVVQATTDTNGQLGFNAPLDANHATKQVVYSYDGNGKLLTIQRSPNFTDEIIVDYYQDTTSTHNVGDLKSIQNILGHQTQYLEYDANGSPTKIIDANGIVTLLTYDTRGRLTSKSTEGQTTTLGYDLNGNLTLISLPNGSTVTREYDGAGRLRAVVDGLLNRYELEYDAEGNRLSSTILNSQGDTLFTDENQYDLLSRLQKTIQASGAEHDFLYDKEGNLTTSTDAKGNSTSQTFDSKNQVKKITDANSGVIDLTYDDANNQASNVTDQENLTTQYEYDSFGHITKLTSPDTGISIFTYDESNNLLTKTDARDVTVTFTYDALNRPLTQSYSDSSENIIYSYDDTTNGNKGIGRLTNVTDQTGSTSYVYNAFGQVTQETQVIDGKTYITETHFDTSGQITGMTYPSGQQINYSFDSLGRVNGLSRTDASQTPAQTSTLASNITYLPFGPMTSFIYGNGKVLNQSYDLDYRLTDKTTTGLNQLSYSYDLTNNITAITGTLQTSQTQSFAYDKLSRLTDANGDYGILDFSYDKIGNRLSKTDNTNVDSYVYAPTSHQLTSITGANPKSFTYDAVGNTLTKDDLTFTYNQQGRLKTASKTGMNAEYQYNFKGGRSIKQVEGVKTHFIYNLQGQLIAEADEQGNVQKETIYLNGQRLATINGGTLYYVHTDHLGTPIALTDEMGVIQWQAHYTPFGKIIVDVDNVTQNIRFPGQYFDAETGLHYNYFRDYDPEIGRYLQSDPIGLNGGINTYGYVGGNPVNFYDPYGLYSMNDFFNDISQILNTIRDSTGGCSNNSALDDIVSNFNRVQDSTGGTAVKTITALALGGATARTYGGLTAGGIAGSIYRDYSRGYRITGIAARGFAPAAGTAIGTVIINGILIKGVYNSGVLVGSIIRTGINRAVSSDCGCQ